MNNRRLQILKQLEKLTKENDKEDTNALDELDAILDSSTEESSNEDTEKETRWKSTNFVAVIESYTPEEFKSQMRIDRGTAEYLIEKYLQQTTMRTYAGGKPAIDARQHVYIYLWYIIKIVTFDELARLFGICKSTAWAIVQKVTSWLISIAHEYIKWPQGADAECTQLKFQEVEGIPGIIGAIGCTHIIIRAPKEHKEKYIDNESKYSIILLAVVDAEMKFTNLSCGEVGSLHHSHVWQRSDLFYHTNAKPDEYFPNSSFIIGNCSYPTSSCLVTPFRSNGQLSKLQENFNEKLTSTLEIIDQAFGLLKTRFGRIENFSDQQNVCVVINIVVSACVLHNICISFNDLIEFEPTVAAPGTISEAHVHAITNRRNELCNYLHEKHFI